MSRHGECVEFFRGDPLEGLNPEPHESIEILQGESNPSPALPVEAASDSAENGREEEIERLMKNISEFIRKIDVTAL